MGAENSTLQNAASCNSANTCRGACKSFESKQTDTVKVDLEKLVENKAGKENADPGQVKETAFEKLQRVEQERLVEEEQERKRYEEQVERRRKEAEKAKQRAEEERKRREMEEEERKRREMVEEQRRQAEKEAQLRELKELRRRQEEEARALLKEQWANEERLRKAKEAEELARRAFEEEEKAREQAQHEEAARLREEVAKSKRLRQYLEEQGFQVANEKKVKKGMISSSFSYPLHQAVEMNDAEAVELLLWAGADRQVANSKKQTPLMLARAKNTKSGSHARVIAALSA